MVINGIVALQSEALIHDWMCQRALHCVGLSMRFLKSKSPAACCAGQSRDATACAVQECLVMLMEFVEFYSRLEPNADFSDSKAAG